MTQFFRNSDRVSPRGALGFTLIELMIVLAIVAVVMAVAVPGFRNLSLSTRLKSYANEVVASVYLARGEAIKRSAAVRLCVSTDGIACASGDWEQGWIVMALDGTVIKWQQASTDGYRLTAGGVDTITFQPSGAVLPLATTIMRICRKTPTAGHQERLVSVSATGRPNVSTSYDGTCT